MKFNRFRLRNVLAVLFFAGTFATLVFAHNKLVKSDPAPDTALKAAPTHIEMWFAEKPDLTVSKIAVKGPSGAVDIGPARSSTESSIAADFKGKLADGRYTVNWQTAGGDGHVSKGEFNFSVNSTH